MHAGANISFRMLSLIGILDTFGYGPELFWIRFWICLDTFGYFLDTNGYFHFGYASFFGYGVFLDIFGYYCCLACTRRAQFPKKSKNLFLDIFWILSRFTCTKRSQFPKKSKKKWLRLLGMVRALVVTWGGRQW